MRYRRTRVVRTQTNVDISGQPLSRVQVCSSPFLLWNGNNLRCLLRSYIVGRQSRQEFLERLSWYLSNPLGLAQWLATGAASIYTPWERTGETVRVVMLVRAYVYGLYAWYDVYAVQAEVARFRMCKLMPSAGFKYSVGALYLAGCLSPELAPIAEIVAEKVEVEELPPPRHATTWVYKASSQFSPAEVSRYSVSGVRLIRHLDRYWGSDRVYDIVVDLEPTGEKARVDAAFGCIGKGWPYYVDFWGRYTWPFRPEIDVPTHSAFPVLAAISPGWDDEGMTRLLYIVALVRPWGSLIGQIVESDGAVFFLGVSQPPCCEICDIEDDVWRREPRFWNNPVRPRLNLFHPERMSDIDPRSISKIDEVTVDQLPLMGPSADVRYDFLLEGWRHSVVMVESELYGAVPLRQNYVVRGRWYLVLG